MIRVLILLFFVSLSPDKLIAQGDPGKQNGSGIAAMEADSMIIVGCLDRSAYYLFQDNKLDTYLDSAWMVLKHARELAGERE